MKGMNSDRPKVLR
jgi:hypothetical protein